MMLSFTTIEPFFIFIQSLLGVVRSRAEKTESVRNTMNSATGGGSLEHTAVQTTAHAAGCLD